MLVWLKHKPQETDLVSRPYSCSYGAQLWVKEETGRRCRLSERWGQDKTQEKSHLHLSKTVTVMKESTGVISSSSLITKVTNETIG